MPNSLVELILATAEEDHVGGFGEAEVVGDVVAYAGGGAAHEDGFGGLGDGGGGGGEGWVGGVVEALMMVLVVVVCGEW